MINKGRYFGKLSLIADRIFHRKSDDSSAQYGDYQKVSQQAEEVICRNIEEPNPEFQNILKQRTWAKIQSNADNTKSRFGFRFPYLSDRRAWLIGSAGIALAIVLAVVVPLLMGREQDEYSGLLTTAVTSQPGDTTTQISGLMVLLDLNGLIKGSDAIVVATVSEIQPSTQGMDHGRSVIYTDVILRVNESLTGAVSGNIAVRVLGGRIGNEVVMAEDSPVFNLHEKVIVFLSRPTSYGQPALIPVPQGIDNSNYFYVTGSLQGKWQYQDGFGVDVTGHKYSVSDIKSQILAANG